MKLIAQFQKNTFVIFSTAFFTLTSCTSVQNKNIPDTRIPAATNVNPRGTPSEYDAGPPKDSQWPDIFAETPDYRTYGKAIYQAAAAKYQVKDDGKEKFRWKVGPMWYRGRLTPESVKVFVIGQEGAQDENASNRTFTGSTGTKMQNFINYLGINRSYLFMNTFIYTITGQYGERAEASDSPEVKKTKEVFSNTLFWLAQNPKSEIVQHRHRMFDYMLSQNKNTLNLVVGVGAAGKDTLATWITSHGGKCTVSQLTKSHCDADVLAPGVKAIGVMHPGAASARNGGADAAEALQIQFAGRAKAVVQLKEKNPNWLQPDEGALTNFAVDYKYGNAVIPFRDFAFGSNWRLGKDGTSTNRRGADGIQIFSDYGCYNNTMRINERCDAFKALPVQYNEPTDLKTKMDMQPGDLPWESPKSTEHRRDYDQGPQEFAKVLMGEADGQQPWPSFKALGVTQHHSFGYGPIYRGHLKNPEVLILADQESQDDLFSARALTGTGGQQFQTFLNALGLVDNYAIIRTLPVDTLDLSIKQASNIALNADVAATRNAILNTVLAQRKTKLIITVGPIAKEAMKSVQTNTPIINMTAPGTKNQISSWNNSLKRISDLKLGFSSQGKYNGELTAIPRSELPIHTRWWMGTSGSRAARAYLKTDKGNQWSGDYYKFDAPDWVNSYNYPADPAKVSDKDKLSIDAFSIAN
ncbi:MAG: hypothetical protein H7256_00735 [Bdellovibrio sp.]|nr:hypothetical protein [Bdellovibrio sp.]